ncbi:MAG: hypothetical protein Q8S13_00555, partial [Dehalococcoidia bacterium]|nr:hypothetical protein [Dehalococcoidia bacterium]
ATKGTAAEHALEKAVKGEKIEKADRKKMIRRPVLEKWAYDLRKTADYPDMVDLLLFILGGSIPEKLAEEAIEMLRKAGWKDPSKKKEKIEKKPKRKKAA